MTFTVAVKIDPSQSVGAAKAIGAALGATEAAGVKAGQSTTAAFDKASISGQKAIQAAKNLAGAFGSVANAMRGESMAVFGNSLAQLTKQFERERDILDEIVGPMQRYQEEVKALEMLQRKGLITADQYTSALAKRNDALPSKMPAAPAAGGGFGIGALAGTVGLTFGAREAVDLFDKYTTLQNKLQNVVASTKGLSKPVGDLYDALDHIALLTRSDVEATTESFIGLSSATRSLGISQERTLELTKRVNEAVVVGGASAEQASAGLMQLGQALSSGTLQGDEFRSISENLPYVRDLIAKSLGVGVDKLREMSAQGKLTSAVIVEAFEKQGVAIDAAYSRTTPTIKQELTVAKNEVLKFAGEVLPVIKQLASPINPDEQRTALADYMDATKEAADVQTAINGSVDRATLYETDYKTSLASTTSELEKITHSTREAAKSTADYKDVVAGISKEQDDFRASLKKLDTEIQVNNAIVVDNSASGKTDRQLAAGGQVPVAGAQQRGLANEFDRNRLIDPGLTTYYDAQQKVQTAELSLIQLQQRRNEGQIKTTADLKLYNKAVHDLQEEIRSAQGDQSVDYFKRVLDDIQQPAIEFRGSVAALDSLMQHGRITAAQYTAEFAKLSETFDSSGFAKMLNAISNKPTRSPRSYHYDDGLSVDGTSAAQRAGMISDGTYGTEYTEQTEGDRAVAEARRRQQDDLEESLRKQYQQPDQPSLDSDLAAFDKRQSASRTPSDVMRDSMNAAKQSFADGSLSASGYADELDRIKRAYMDASGESKTFSGAADLAWMDITKQAEDAAGQLQKTMKDAYSGIEDALVDLAVHGKANWKSMIDSMLEDLARLALKEAVLGFASGNYAQGIAGLAGYGAIAGTSGALGNLGGFGTSSRVTQDVTPSQPVNAPTATSASRTAPIVNVHVTQEKNALLPALDTRSGRRTVAIAVKDSGIGKAIRGRSR